MPKIKVDMPLDVRKHVLRYQADLNTKKGLKSYSQQQTIYTIIREHEDFCKERDLKLKTK